MDYSGAPEKVGCLGSRITVDVYLVGTSSFHKYFNICVPFGEVTMSRDLIAFTVIREDHRYDCELGVVTGPSHCHQYILLPSVRGSDEDGDNALHILIEDFS